MIQRGGGEDRMEGDGLSWAFRQLVDSCYQRLCLAAGGGVWLDKVKQAHIPPVFWNLSVFAV